MGKRLFIQSNSEANIQLPTCYFLFHAPVSLLTHNYILLRPSAVQKSSSPSVHPEPQIPISCKRGCTNNLFFRNHRFIHGFFSTYTTVLDVHSLQYYRCAVHFSNTVCLINCPRAIFGFGYSTCQIPSQARNQCFIQRWYPKKYHTTSQNLTSPGMLPVFQVILAFSASYYRDHPTVGHIHPTSVIAHLYWLRASVSTQTSSGTSYPSRSLDVHSDACSQYYKPIGTVPFFHHHHSTTSATPFLLPNFDTKGTTTSIIIIIIIMPQPNNNKNHHARPITSSSRRPCSSLDERARRA